MRHPAISLRKKILRLLLPLMVLLIAIDSAVLHNIAMRGLQKELDAHLLNIATEISEDMTEFSEVTKKSINEYRPEAEINNYLLKDDSGKKTYCITNEDGRFLNGDRDLCNIFYHHAKKQNNHFFFTKTNSKKIRVLSYTFNLKDTLETRSLIIRIASTLNYRDELANKILLGIVIPQLLLVFISFIVIFISVKKGLEPLNTLQTAIASRSEQNLNPINLPDSPEEIFKLTNAINGLMLRISNLVSIQNRFIADAAHQLRTPLAGARAQLEVAEQDNRPAVIKSTLPKVQQSLDRLLHTVNQLLLLAKSQPEAISMIKMEAIDLNIVAKEVASEMAPTAIQKQIDLGFECGTTPALIVGNVERLKVLLYNLLDNAIRYTQNNGKVTVSISVTDATVELLVADNGPGIAEDERDKIFERFHRVVGSGEEGSGLGLAIVKEIANLHNATITVLDTEQLAGLQLLISFNKYLEYKI